MTTTVTARAHPKGAPLLPPAVAYVVLAVGGVIGPPLAAGQAPYSSDADLLGFYTHGGAAHLLAFLILASAVPFAVCTAIASHRVRAAGLEVPGPLIALVGGAIAAGMLALSGLCSLALTETQVAQSPSVVRGLNALAFAAGGPGFVVFSGLLVAGISIPLLVGHLAPRWIGWFGLATAAVCEVASLTAATAALNPLLPLGRFATMAWLLAVAATLSTARHAEQERDRP